MSSPFHAYAALVAGQLAALEADDLGLLATLTADRDALAPAIARSETAGPEALAALHSAADLDRQLLHQLRLRRDALSGQIDTERAAGTQLRAYVRAAAAGTLHAVDLSL